MVDILFAIFVCCSGLSVVQVRGVRSGAVWKRARSHPGERDRCKKIPLSRFVLVRFVVWLVPIAPQESRRDTSESVCGPDVGS